MKKHEYILIGKSNKGEDVMFCPKCKGYILASHLEQWAEMPPMRKSLAVKIGYIPAKASK